tara:strand:- start:9596 stop:9937 length:342 start_codon:yes stop_codon:yes gene_type:complete
MKRIFLVLMLFVGLTLFSNNAMASDLNSVLNDVGSQGKDIVGWILKSVGLFAAAVIGGNTVRMYITNQIDFMGMIRNIAIVLIALGSIFVVTDTLLPVLLEKGDEVTDMTAGF